MAGGKAEFLVQSWCWVTVCKVLRPAFLVFLPTPKNIAMRCVSESELVVAGNECVLVPCNGLVSEYWFTAASHSCSWKMLCIHGNPDRKKWLLILNDEMNEYRKHFHSHACGASEAGLSKNSNNQKTNIDVSGAQIPASR